MRTALVIALLVSAVATTAPGQEHLGTTWQAQTVAPNVTLDRPQPASCGAAPSVTQINRMVLVVRRMFPQPAAFDGTLTSEIRKPCPRNYTGAYLIHLIANNSWTFVPGVAADVSYPYGPFTCGKAASAADLNTVIAKLRPLFANPGRMDANVAAIARMPCVDGRATLYLFNLMATNNVALRH